tara:strand:- start:181 stop:1239 length:1059 start_codon:yes stop_codon:yes gene_type:complete
MGTTKESEEALAAQAKVDSKVDKSITEIIGELTKHFEERAKAGADPSELEFYEKTLSDLGAVQDDNSLSIAGEFVSAAADLRSSRKSFVDQGLVSGVVDSELDSAKKNLRSIMHAKNNQQRMTEINTYYSNSYQAHTYTMKLIIYAVVPILLISILSKKNILPPNIAKVLSTLVMVIVGLLMIIHLMDIRRRDNMVYTEYDFGTAPKSNFSTSSSYSSQGEVCEEDLLDNDNATDILNTLKNDPNSDTQEQITQLNEDGICNDACVKCYASPTEGVRGYDNKWCDSYFGNSNCENCDDIEEPFQGNIVRESFENSNIPSNVAYVASPTPSCPWGKSSSVVKPFGPNENYATV